MRLTFLILLVAFAVAGPGCASKHPPVYSDVPRPAKVAPPSKPVITPSTAVTGKVVRFNQVGRFAVLNFSLAHMPTLEQTMFVYRNNLKVGEVKVNGPQLDDNVCAELTSGEAAAGDEVRDR